MICLSGMVTTLLISLITGFRETGYQKSSTLEECNIADVDQHIEFQQNFGVGN